MYAYNEGVSLINNIISNIQAHDNSNGNVLYTQLLIKYAKKHKKNTTHAN